MKDYYKYQGHIADRTIELHENFNWQSFRAEAAKDILCAMLSNSNLGYYGNEVDNAVIYADKLIAKLKEKEEK